MYDHIFIGNNQIDKHEKYKYQYEKNNLYWGLGIENELYLEFESKKLFSKNDFFNNHNRERYSVNYFSNYKKEFLHKAFTYIINLLNNEIQLPILINSNSFTKTDYNNHSKTIYNKNTDPNPKFNGNTLIETLQNENKYFSNSFENNWLFDGDTVEFANKFFYKVKLQDVLKEIYEAKIEFINNINTSFSKLNIFNDYGKVKFMEHNHSFATYMTNLNNIAMFNNGTLHYNLTLPTNLNEEGLIKDKNKFIHDHKKAIQIIQWMEPFILTVYGSKDPFSLIDDDLSINFSACSQRCAISRYIGIGTYDSDQMEPGKILVKKTTDILCNQCDYWWFNKYYENNAYVKLNEIGLDINFNKHYNHGIEIRFLDHINDNEKIYESFEFIIYLMDYILESNNHIIQFGNPIINEKWNNIVLNIMYYGKEYDLTDDEHQLYENIFQLKLKKTNIVDIYYELYCKLIFKYNKIYKLKNKNNFILKPYGIYSSLTLYTDNQKIINNDILNNIDYNNFEENHIKQKCCIMC